VSSITIVFIGLTYTGIDTTGSSKAGTLSSKGSRYYQILPISIYILIISIYSSQSAGLFRITEIFYNIDIIELNLIL
jgi:hypothetical protein